MPKQYSWNMDGLIVRSGVRTEENANIATVTATEGLEKELTAFFDLARPGFYGVIVGNNLTWNATTFDNFKEGVTNGARIPLGALVTEVRATITTTFSGGSVAQPVNVALFNSETGVYAGATLGTNLTALTAGTETVKTSSYVVAGVGANGGVLAPTFTTGIPTAGAMRVTVKYQIPTVS